MSEQSIEKRFLSAEFFELLRKVRRRYSMYGDDALSTLRYIQSETNAKVFLSLLEKLCHVCGLNKVSIEMLSAHFERANQHPLSQVAGLMEKIDQAFLVKRRQNA